MAFIKPGIHENCKFGAESKINDKGTLVLDIEVAPKDIMSAFEGNDTLDTMRGSFMIFPPNVKGFEGEDRSNTEIAEDLMKMRKLLLTYASLLGPKVHAEAAFGSTKMFEGIGITKEQIPQLIENFQNEKVVQKVSTNLQTLFLNYVKSLPTFTTATFRHKFWRKNKKENFAIIPNNQLDVFVESMEVPQEATKIVWSEWEIKNKKNDPNPASADDTTAAPEDAQNLFDTDPAETDTQEGTMIDSLI